MVQPATTLHTPRLMLDQPRLTDVPRLIEACNEPNIKRVISHPATYTQTDALEYINWFVPHGWHTGRRYTWMIRLRDQADQETSLLLGQISLNMVPEDNAATIGYWLHPDAERHGYLTEAAQRVLEQAFAPDGMNLERVYWNAYVGNLRCAHLAARLGFTYRGRVDVHELGWNSAGDAWVAVLGAADPRVPQTWDVLTA